MNAGKSVAITGDKIDPDGGVIFLLEGANAPFAVWDEKKISQPTPKKPLKKLAKKKIKLEKYEG